MEAKCKPFHLWALIKTGIKQNIELDFFSRCLKYVLKATSRNIPFFFWDIKNYMRKSEGNIICYIELLWILCLLSHRTVSLVKDLARRLSEFPFKDIWFSLYYFQTKNKQTLLLYSKLLLAKLDEPKKKNWPANLEKKLSFRKILNLTSPLRWPIDTYGKSQKFCMKLGMPKFLVCLTTIAISKKWIYSLFPSGDIINQRYL